MIPVDFVPSSSSAVCARMKSAMFKELNDFQDLGLQLGCKLDIYTYQVETVLRAMRTPYPRLILADEVGLGKTIEALLILKEMQQRGNCDRAILLVPASLVDQWKGEMMEKFSMDPLVLDREGLRTVDLSLPGLYLCSLDLAKRHPEIFEDLKWDAIIIDEAHHLRRQLGRGGQRTTHAYALAALLSQRTKALLLLTATPMQMEEFEFFSLLALVDDGIFTDFASFSYYYDTLLPHINAKLRAIDEGTPLSSGEMEMLRARVVELFNGAQIPPLPPHPSEWRKFLSSLLVFPRLMVRHRRRLEFPSLLDREVHTIRIKYSEEEASIYRDIRGMLMRLYRQEGKKQNLGMLAVNYQQMLTSSPRAIATSLRNTIRGRYGGDSHDEDLLNGALKRSEVEEFINRLQKLRSDSKAEAAKKIVGEILSRDPQEKIIIFTRFIETQNYLKCLLETSFKVTLFNGDMSDEEKNQRISDFKGETNILISTEAGAEGRNFQFCHIMVNYDLPWNPMRLEQRIGRIDRLGQRRRVIVYNLMLVDTVEANILQALLDRFARFEGLLGISDVILGDMEGSITDLVFAAEAEGEMVAAFVDTLDAKIAKAKEAENYFDELMVFQSEDGERAIASQKALSVFPSLDLECFIIEQLSRISGASVRTNSSQYDIYIPANSELGNAYEIRTKGSFVSAGPSVALLDMHSRLIRQVVDSKLREQGCLIAQEDAAGRKAGTMWCFDGGEGRGYCVIRDEGGRAAHIPALEVVSGHPSRNAAISMQRMTSDEMLAAYERSRLLAERILRYPEGGASLVALCIISPQDRRARA